MSSMDQIAAKMNQQLQGQSIQTKPLKTAKKPVLLGKMAESPELTNGEIKEALLKAGLIKEQLNLADVNVTRGGDTIILPEGMTYSQAGEWLKLKEAQEKKLVEVMERIEGFPLDVSHALQLAVKRKYGFVELQKIPGNFFAPDQPPAYIRTPIDHTGATVEVFIGRFTIPGMETGYLETSPAGSEALWIRGQIQARHMPAVSELIKLTREILASESLYKGKAIRVGKPENNNFAFEDPLDTPIFMDIADTPPVIYLNADTQALVEAAILKPIQFTEECRVLGIPRKRGALLVGPFGVGKTLTARLTAYYAVRHGWTFIYVEDPKRLAEYLRFAARYAPAVIFAEDIDQGHMEEIPNLLDGIDTKNQELMVVLTTNYPEKVPPILLRPGRLDAVVSFSAPDAETAEKLIAYYAGNLLDEDIQLAPVGKELAGMIPAVIREVVERAKLSALTSDITDLSLSADDILVSARGMKYQLSLLNRELKPKRTPMEQLGLGFANALAPNLVNLVGLHMTARGGNTPVSLAAKAGEDD